MSRQNSKQKISYKGTSLSNLELFKYVLVPTNKRPLTLHRFPSWYSHTWVFRTVLSSIQQIDSKVIINLPKERKNHMSHVTSHVSYEVELVGGGSVINGAYPI